MPCRNFHIDIKPPDSVRLRNGMGTYIDNIIQSTRKVLHLWHSRIALRHLVWWSWWIWLSVPGPLWSTRASLEGGSLGPVLPCTGGMTAEHALGLSSYQCCVCAALYRGQDCRTCSWVVQVPVLCLCCLVQGVGLQNVLWGCSATCMRQAHKSTKTKSWK